MGAVMVAGVMRGEPGSRVWYRENPDGSVDVLVGIHRLVNGLPAGTVVELDEDYTPSRVFVTLRLSQGNPESAEWLRDSFLLARNTARLFDSHSLSEDLLMLACELASRHEATLRDGAGSYPHTRMLVREYGRNYPRGRFRDRLAWLEVKVRHRRLLLGGTAAGALATLEACQRFLALHPRVGCRAEVKQEMARCCLVAAGRLEAKDPVLAGRYQRRAEYLWRGLAEHADLVVRHAARVELYELQNPT